MYKRKLTDSLLNDMKRHSVLALFGARRTGKTFLLNQLKRKIGEKNVLLIEGDNMDNSDYFSGKRLSVLKRMVSGYRYLFIDEAQMIPEIGHNLKLLADNIPELHMIITGSSSMDLYQKTGEPLTGRSKYFRLHPIALSELNENYITLSEKLDSRLIYGMYPQILTSENDNDRKDILASIRNGYLLKDVLMLDNQKDAPFVLSLLRLIAYQIGNDVSFSSLANDLGVNKKTVMRYLDILEKCYVIFSLRGFSRNIRKEFTQTPRYYFWDNGIRNSIIANFNQLNRRDDAGKLWENFVISERLKYVSYTDTHCIHYFWRTYDQQEIDLIEEKNGKLTAFECKLKDEKARPPKAFINAYPKSIFNIVNRINFTDFLL